MDNNLKNLRKLKKVSQNDLADALSVSRQTINSIENGKFDITILSGKFCHYGSATNAKTIYLKIQNK